MAEVRKRVADLADAFCAGSITLEQFRSSISDDDTEDELVGELVDMIMHEPHVGWFLGVSKAQGIKERAKVIAFINRLRE